MKIETKLNIDDEAYFVEADGVRKGHVVRMEILVESDSLGGKYTSITYTIVHHAKARYINEALVFASLEETLKYLEQKFYVENEQ